MRMPGFTRRTLSRRFAPDGWLVRISVRLSGGDIERLGAEADIVRDAMAVRVAAAARPGDNRTLLARDQYLLAIRSGRRSSDSSDPIPVVRRLLADLAKPVESAAGPIFPRLNASFTMHPCDASNEAARAALAAGLGDAERRGSGVVVAVDLEAGTTKALTLDTPETETVGLLKRAIDAGQVVMHYQPVVRLSDNRVTSFEALMRVIDENGSGLLAPSHFIETAEQSGLIHELGRIALDTAAAQMLSWRETFGETAPSRIAVNVAPPQLANVDFAAEARAAFAGVGLNALTLELTESAMIQEMPLANATLDALRAEGAWVALDDFGVEYSNLSYLRDLAIDVVKIDRSFLDTTDHTERAATILTKIVELAHLLDAEVVAEGVASAEQAKALGALGIDYGQGSHFGLAMDAAAAGDVIARTK